MKPAHRIIGYRAIRNRATGKFVTPLAAVYADDWPYHNVAPDQSLLRYMDLWKFEDLCKTQELYFTRADKFADPLEGSLSKQEIHGTSNSDVAFAAAAKIDRAGYEKAAEYRATAKGCTFINCWHINTNEDQRMWDTYTTSPDSVVVITTARRLAAAMKQSVFGSRVRYVSENTPRTEFDERSLFFYKDVAYEFEREFRLLIDLINIGGSVHRDAPVDFFRRVPIDLSMLIYAIQPHPCATQETKDKIEAVVRRHLPEATEC